MTPSPPDPAIAWTWRGHAPGVPAERLARDWLAERFAIAADALELQRDERNRPRLRGAQAGFDCSWSHSGDGLLLALGAGVELGADLERERPRPRALALAQRYFTAEETAWLAAQRDEAARDRVFLRLWCAKEAVLKAHGHGVVFGLHRLRFAERDGVLALADCDPGLGRAADWTLQELRPAAGYVGALAWRRG